MTPQSGCPNIAVFRTQTVSGTYLLCEPCDIHTTAANYKLHSTRILDGAKVKCQCEHSKHYDTEGR